MTSLVPNPSDRSPRAELATAKIAKHVAESGHWYAFDGTQVLEVPKKTGGGMKKVTLREARELDLCRGVTSYLKRLDKPPLTNWKIDQAILATLRLPPRRADETEGDYIARVKIEAMAQVEAAAGKGTEIHAAVQAHIGGETVDPAMREHVDGILAKLPTQGGPWRAELGVAHPNGFGTKVDLLNDVYLLDFKSKDGDQASLDEEPLYAEHEMQLVAGMMAVIEGYPPRCGRLCAAHRKLGIVFVSRTHPGACSIRWMPEGDIDRAWQRFCCLVTMVHLEDRHRPFLNKKL